MGRSNPGIRILYSILNGDPRFLCERTYAPWPDMEREMRATGMPLFSLESKRPAGEFDVIGFSLGYETVYTNVLTMLDLAGLPLLSEQRSNIHPIVVAGGHGAYNPEPMSLFIDAFCIGEGEEAMVDLLEQVDRHRRDHGGGMDRQSLLKEIAALRAGRSRTL